MNNAFEGLVKNNVSDHKAQLEICSVFNNLEIKYVTLLKKNKELLAEVSKIDLQERKRQGLKDNEFIISGNFRLNQLHSEIHEIVNTGASERLLKRN